MAEELRLIGAEFFRKANEAETQRLRGTHHDRVEGAIAGGETGWL